MKHLYLLLLLVCSASTICSQNLYFPPSNSNAWDTISPESLGWCQDSIESLYTLLDEEATKSFIVLKDGKIVLEKYFGTYDQDSLWLWFSAGKSLRALLIGIAQEEGFLEIEDRTLDYLGSGWTSLPPEKEELITIWHQLTMTAGLDEEFFTCIADSCLIYKADAGTRWYYHNGPYSLLKNVLEEATGLGINQYTNSRLRNKIGMQSGFWLPAGDNTFFVSRARDMARFGLLIQNDGTWDNTPVISDSEYFEAMINTSQELNPSYGYLWWLNGKDTYIPPGVPFSFPGSIAPNAPEDVVLAAGAQGQYISISPSEGLVVVRQGLSSSPDLAAIDLHDRIWERLMQLTCTTTGITEQSSDAIRIYPNPATNVLHIKGSTNEIIRVYNSLGQLHDQIHSNTTVNIQEWPAGIYYLIAGSGEHLKKEVIIVK
jgi:CubicO group peptidase (beta-lactamase class C family)